MSSAPQTISSSHRGNPLQVVRRRSRKLIKRRSTRRVAPIALLAVIFTGAIIFGVLLEQVVLAQTAFKLERLTKQTQVAQERNGELLLRSSRLGSPARIEKYARMQLGMIDPTTVQYIIADVHPRAGRTISRSTPVADSAPPGPAVAAPSTGGTP